MKHSILISVFCFWIRFEEESHRINPVLKTKNQIFPIKNFYSKSESQVTGYPKEKFQIRSKSAEYITQEKQIMKDPNAVTAFNENGLFEKTSKEKLFHVIIS